MKQLVQKTSRIGLSLFLLVGLLAGFLTVSGAQTAQAQTQANTISYYDWFDLETGTIIQISPSDPVPAAADFRFAYNTGFTPHAVIFQNQGAGVQIAYSTEPSANVTFNDVASLTFTTSLIDQPFNQVAVLMTPEGNYFKIGFVNESDPNVTFQWEQLIQCPAGRYDNGTGCVPADPGYYVPVAGATSQIPCLAGYYQDQAGATSCKPASAGSYVSTTGATSATFCPAGKYQPYVGQTSCIPADPGYYVPGSGAIEQLMCEVGYTSDAGAVECYKINTAPTANASGPYLGAVNTSIAFDGSASSDPEADSLTYAWDFGDSSSGSGVMPSNSYAAAGIYTVCLTVNDGLLDSAPACTMAVVYDPSAGFVTGGGWIDSPVGAYAADTSMTGKATFGFVAKYKKGANVPDGNTEFQFKAGDLNFKSMSYEWLVVAGNKAQFKGEGTINGQGSYQFMITADDDNPDTFRINIWDENGTIYDNGSQQSLGGGSIVVHSKK